MTIIHADCLDELRRMPSKSIDLLCTDPPYAMGMARYGRIGLGQLLTPKLWDDARPSERCFREMLRVARTHVVWGGNLFTSHLPPSRCWLVWWKKDGLRPGKFADCELAWTSFDRPARVFNSRWSGFVKDSRETQYPHPTQKSLEVMKWCVASFSKPGDLVLDPFAGTGTTGVACILLGRRFIGIERDAEYVQMARERLLMARFGKI